MKPFGELDINLQKLKPKKLFYHLFPVYFSISVTGIIILLFITGFAFKNFYYNEITNSLTQKAKILENDIKRFLLQQKFQELEEYIKELSVKSENRITVTLKTGQVIADSSFNYKKMESHKEREEIKEALKGKVGQTVRFSATLKKTHLYVAIPITHENKIIGAIRTSVSDEELTTSLFELIKNLLLWSFLLLIILTYFIYVQGKKISKPLEELKEQVENLSSDKFQDGLKIKKTTTTEINSLFMALQNMSVRLEKQFKKINEQRNEQLGVFAGMIEGVITISPDMKVHHINQAAINLFNYDVAKYPKGTPIKEIIKSENLIEVIEEMLITKKTVEEEIVYNDLTLLFHGAILNVKDSKKLGAVLVFNNITKMRKLENHRKEFVANVSHELKTPLTAIQGYLETVQGSEIEDKETLSKFLKIIDKHAVRLNRIVEDLLNLSSIEKESEIGALKLERQNLLPHIKNVIELCHEKSSQKKIQINLEAVDVEVMLNYPLFEQALINLVDNAVKYSPIGSQINISLHVADDLAIIKVMDQGPGIAKKHHERLFERFYSVDKARSRELGGSGLGLSIVKHIVLSHGGNARVESESNNGSTFILEFPIPTS